ncbi:MAG: TetR/AcrR family transcriptional regulator [Ktedonobacterales bacterium]
MPKRTHQTHTAREARILQAAVVCLAHAGYHGTTMEEIAVTAGIAKGGAYRYFPSKEALFLALYDEWGCHLDDGIQAALESLSPERASPRRTLRLILEVAGRYVQEESALCRVLMDGRTLGAYIPAIRKRVEREQALTAERIAELLRTGIAAGEWPDSMPVAAQTTLLLTALHGPMASWRLAPGSFDWDEMAALLVP